MDTTFRELPIVWKSMLEYLQLSISIKNNLKKERKKRRNINHLPLQ